MTTHIDPSRVPQTDPTFRTSFSPRLRRLQLGRFGLLGLLVLVFLIFSLDKPHSFATWANVQVTSDQQVPVVIGGLAVLLPLLTDSIDLSVAANISIANILLAGLTTNHHLGVAISVVITILASTVVGLLNGLIVEKLQVTSFVATLGMATVLSGVGLAFAHSQDILSVPSGVTTMVRTHVWGVPLSVLYAIIAALVVGFVLRFLPAGRRLRAVGANARAAELTGIRPGRYRILSFTAGGALAGIAGVILTGQLGAATASGSADSLLLPIFAAVFLGSTAFTPGRPNVPGLIVAAMFLAFVSDGLVMVGAPAWESPLINGGGLIVAVALSSWALRLRGRRLRAEQLRQLEREPSDQAAPRSRPDAVVS